MKFSDKYRGYTLYTYLVQWIGNTPFQVRQNHLCGKHGYHSHWPLDPTLFQRVPSITKAYVHIHGDGVLNWHHHKQGDSCLTPEVTSLPYVITGRGEWKQRNLIEAGQTAYNFAKRQTHQGLQYVHNKYKNKGSFLQQLPSHIANALMSGTGREGIKGGGMYLDIGKHLLNEARQTAFNIGKAKAHERLMYVDNKCKNRKNLTAQTSSLR